MPQQKKNTNAKEILPIILDTSDTQSPSHEKSSVTTWDRVYIQQPMAGIQIRKLSLDPRQRIYLHRARTHATRTYLLSAPPDYTHAQMRKIHHALRLTGSSALVSRVLQGGEGRHAASLSHQPWRTARALFISLPLLALFLSLHLPDSARTSVLFGARFLCITVYPACARDALWSLVVVVVVFFFFPSGGVRCGSEGFFLAGDGIYVRIFVIAGCWSILL